MADRQKASAGQAGVNGSGGFVFPPEALEHQNEVTKEQIENFRESIGVNFESDEWEVIDGFGKIVNA